MPVGTEYHWYILAHQNVEKLNANDYTTSLSAKRGKKRKNGRKARTPPSMQKRGWKRRATRS